MDENEITFEIEEAMDLLDDYFLEEGNPVTKHNINTFVKRLIEEVTEFKENEW